MIDLRTVQPVILTCARDPITISKFVWSYRATFRQVWENLRAMPPIVVLDQSSGDLKLSGDYLQQLASLWPKLVQVHPLRFNEPDCLSTTEQIRYSSIQHAARTALELAYAHREDAQYVLFIEDDIIFSSQFAQVLGGLSLPERTGFMTFYLPGGGHSRSEEVNAEYFYGTQAVLFPIDALELVVTRYDEALRKYTPGYDIHWSRILRDYGFSIRETELSYVQHIGQSKLHPGKFHESSVFVP